MVLKITDLHDITEILLKVLKVALNTITPPLHVRVSTFLLMITYVLILELSDKNVISLERSDMALCLTIETCPAVRQSAMSDFHRLITLNRCLYNVLNVTVGSIFGHKVFKK